MQSAIFSVLIVERTVVCRTTVLLQHQLHYVGAIFEEREDTVHQFASIALVLKVPIQLLVCRTRTSTEVKVPYSTLLLEKWDDAMMQSIFIDVLMRIQTQGRTVM